MSKIAADTAAALMAIFAGQTVTLDEVNATITQQYEMARKRPGLTSYFAVADLCEAAGMTSRYTGPDYTGECLMTFPAIDLDHPAA